MRQTGGDCDLTQKSLCAKRCAELRTQHFHRDLASMLSLLGEVHRRHTPATKLALDDVTVRE